MEKELKKTTETLDEERNRQKHMVLLLLAERKKVITKYIEERKRSEDLSQVLWPASAGADAGPSDSAGTEKGGAPAASCMHSDLECVVFLVTVTSDIPLNLLARWFSGVCRHRLTCTLLPEDANCRIDVKGTVPPWIGCQIYPNSIVCQNVEAVLLNLFVISPPKILRTLQDKEDSSWDRVQDKDIFSRRVTGRPSDEGARSARNAQGKDILILHEDT